MEHNVKNILKRKSADIYAPTPAHWTGDRFPFIHTTPVSLHHHEHGEEFKKENMVGTCKKVPNLFRFDHAWVKFATTEVLAADPRLRSGTSFLCILQILWIKDEQDSENH